MPSLRHLRLFLSAFLVLTIPLAAQGQPMESGQVGTTTPTPELAGIRIVQKIGDRIPLGAEFLDHDGHKVKIGDIVMKRPVLLLPIFYRCKGVCNIELQSVIDAVPKMEQRIGKEFDVVVLGINPAEGPELARGKLDAVLESSPAFKGTESGWHFLTGTYEQILSVTDAVGFQYKYDAEKDIVNHPSGIMFLTPTGIVSSYVLGANYTPDVLARNLDLASQNRIGTKVQDVFFGCVHIDPLTGQRSLVVVQALKVAGVLTLVAIAAAVFTWNRMRAR